MAPALASPVILAKLALISGIRERIAARRESQADVARVLNIGPDMVCRLVGGQHDRFSIDWLINTTTRLGGHIRLAVE